MNTRIDKRLRYNLDTIRFKINFHKKTQIVEKYYLKS